MGDLPEFFEDQMSVWMPNFLKLLVEEVPVLLTNDDEEPGLMEFVRSQICENVSMYAQKYDEEFSSHLEGFVTSTWSLLVRTGAEMKYDLLVSNAIGFLKSVCLRQQYKYLFENEGTLVEI